ncbi:hypothetical protein ACIQVU_00515 [Lysinibacillus sp. NPDC098008]|uniref:hypothetical protein n=1 Tax=Lysinibacillus sp. NPDC098008 TaxID=3364146 RepID=UPI00382E681B
MLISSIQNISVLYYWTWFIWPFVFIFSLIYAINSVVKDEKTSIKPVIIASISLLVILAGITGPLIMS